MKTGMNVILCIAMAAAILSGCAAAHENAVTESEDKETVDRISMITDMPTTQYFTDEEVSEGDISKILLAGINAPSAMNQQPWHFSVITDKAVMQEIADNMSFGSPKETTGINAPEKIAPPEDAVSPEGAKLPKDMLLPEGAVPPLDAKASDVEGFKPAPSNKAGMRDAPLAIVVSCKEGSELDAGLACQNMSVEAVLLGYGTKIISSPTMALNGEKADYFSEMLGIPQDQRAAVVLLVGRENASTDTTPDTYTKATERNPIGDIVSFIKP